MQQIVPLPPPALGKLTLAKIVLSLMPTLCYDAFMVKMPSPLPAKVFYTPIRAINSSSVIVICGCWAGALELQCQHQALDQMSRVCCGVVRVKFVAEK